MGTTKYKIQLGDEIIVFEGPDGLTDEQVEQLADEHLKNVKPGESFSPSIYDDGTEAVELPEYQEEDSSSVGAFLRSLPKDASFNFADEVASFGNAAIPGLAELDNWLGSAGGEQQGPLNSDLSFWERVRANMGDYKAQADADEELHPVASTGGRITGALATLPRAGMTVASKLPQVITSQAAKRPILTAAGLGAGGGAVSGAGAGEEGTRAQSAALGGTTGAALGLGIASGMAFAPAVAEYAKIFMNKGTTKEAINQIVKALGRDGFDVKSPSGVQKLKDALQEYTGKPVSLADIGGAMRSRTGVGMRAPSAAQQPAIDSIRARQAGQGQRLARDVRTHVAPRTDVHALDEALVEQRATTAKELRDKALFQDGPVLEAQARPQITAQDTAESGLMRTLGEEAPQSYSQVPAAVPEATMGRISRIVDDPELQQLARLPDAQRALQAAVKRATAERDLLAATGQSIDHLPDISAGADLDMRTFDYLKRFLDDEVNALYKRGDTATFKAGEAAQVRALRDAIRNRLRVAVPEYGEYLDAYAGSSEMIDALGEGRKFTDLDPEEIVAGQAGRSEAGQELFRTGAARNLLDIIRGTPDTANPASRILNSPEARDQLQATGVPDDAVRALFNSAERERTFNLLPQELAGAQTAQRLAAQADANAGADINVPFNPASPVPWFGMLGRKILSHTSVNRNAAVNEELLPRMIETDPAAVSRIVDELEQAGQFTKAQEIRRAVRMKNYSGLSGVMIGGPVALEGE